MNDIIRYKVMNSIDNRKSRSEYEASGVFKRAWESRLLYWGNVRR